MKNIIKTALIIIFIYGVIVLYLLMVSDRFEKLEYQNHSSQESVVINTDD